MDDLEQNKGQLGNADQLQMALEAAIEETRSLCEELETLRDSARRAVKAWKIGYDQNFVMAMEKLESTLL